MTKVPRSSSIKSSNFQSKKTSAASKLFLTECANACNFSNGPLRFHLPFVNISASSMVFESEVCSGGCVKPTWGERGALEGIGGSIVFEGVRVRGSLKMRRIKKITMFRSKN